MFVVLSYFSPNNQSPSKICKHPLIQIDIAVKFVIKNNAITLEPGIDILIPILPLSLFNNFLKYVQPTYLLICFATKSFKVYRPARSQSYSARSQSYSKK